MKPVAGKGGGAGLCKAAWMVLLSLTIGCSLSKPGHTVPEARVAACARLAPELTAFYEQYGASRVFGQPISDAYVETDGRTLKQYLENVQLVLDLQTEVAAVAPLGRWAMGGPQDGTGVPVEEPIGGQAASGAGLAVADEFLPFYEEHGGERVFGPPISPRRSEGGVRIQYFANARLEWRPEQPADARVQVSRLGAAHYLAEGRYHGPLLAEVLEAGEIREAALTVHLRAPIVYRGEEQVVFVDVFSSECLRPVSGVTAEVVVSYGDTSEALSLPLTDAEGHTQGSISLDGVAGGQEVTLEIVAASPDRSWVTTSRRSFTVWW
jgi:hypothetical protein